MNHFQFRNDDNIAYSEEDGGSITNASERIVLLRTPENTKELLRLFNDFESRLKKFMFRLLATPYAELNEAFGSLNHTEKHAERRNDTLYGLMATGVGIPKYTNMRKSALVQSMVDLKMVNPLTPHGKKRKRLVRGDGSVVDIIEAKPREEQVKIIRNLVDNYDIDEYLSLGQTLLVGMTKLREFLSTAKDPAEALDQIAGWAWADAYQPLKKRDRESRAKGSDHEFAPVWFAQYLCTRRVWLFPLSYAGAVRRTYPSKLLPLLCWMSVPDDCGGIAENIISLERSSVKKTTTEMCVNAFVAASLASDMWSSRRFCPAPLISLKEDVAHDMLSASANHVYNYLANLFSVDVARRWENPAFNGNKRLDAPGWAGFTWCFKPNPQNTKLVSKILKRPVESVPPHVQEWARQLDPLLRLYGVKDIKGVIKGLNVWLCFLMTLDPDVAPRSFADINRRSHVNDLKPNSKTFAGFLDRHFSKNRAEFGRRAVSKIAQAWKSAANLNDFDVMLSNPFDVKMDGPAVPAGQKKTNFSTVRSPMEFAAFFLILSENRRNFYEFARKDPKFTHRLRNPESGLMEDVFWPIEALIIDVILSTGSRNMDARWLDSGEGDEMVVDIDHVREVDNLLPSATLGRKFGFLRAIPVLGQRNVLGMFRSSNKTGNLEEVPYMDEELARNFQRFVQQQALYNPIKNPVKLVDQRNESPHAAAEMFDWVFPAFRRIGSKNGAAISPERLRSYWLALLKHCQPLVNELLGYEYPLIKGNRAVFDLHSLRVTLVTFLLDENVNPDFVRRIVGHASLVMTWYYHGLRTRALHDNVRKAIERLKGVVDKAVAGDRAALLELADTAYIDQKSRENVGVERLRVAAEASEPPRYERFDHGLCANGVCSQGRGKDRGVWRTRACSDCIFRVTGPHFLEGLINRANSLMLEIKESFSQSADFNRRIEELEEETGKPQDELRQSVVTLDRDREQLCLEWAIEAKTALSAEAKLMEMLHQGGEGRVTGKSVATARDTTMPSLGFEELDELELFHVLVRDCHDKPLSEFHFSSGRIKEFVGKVKRLVLVNDLQDLLYRIPASSEMKQLIEFAGVAIENIGPSKVREFIARSEELQVSPELVEPEVRKLLSDKVNQKALEHAD